MNDDPYAGWKMGAPPPCYDVPLRNLFRKKKDPPYLRAMHLTDVHIPYNVDLSPVEEFMADFKPDILGYGGDILDLDYISRFNVEMHYSGEGKRLHKDADLATQMLDRHARICGKDVARYWLSGNHELRIIERLIEQNPSLSGLVNEDKLLGLKERNIAYVPYGGVVRMGKLNFIHGIYVGDGHAKRHVTSYNKNIRYGHVHTYQVYAATSPLDEFHTGMSIPTLGTLSPRYMRGKPHSWINGFWVGYIFADGLFSDYCIIMNRGKFAFNGKVYHTKPPRVGAGEKSSRSAKNLNGR